MIKNDFIIRKASFFGQLTLSETTISNYKSALNSRFLKEILKNDYKVSEIFEIEKLEDLWDLYSKINLHPRNIANHRSYSAAIMKYIRFLNNGNKYGKRIDYLKRKGPRKKYNHSASEPEQTD